VIDAGDSVGVVGVEDYEDFQRKVFVFFYDGGGVVWFGYFMRKLVKVSEILIVVMGRNRGSANGNATTRVRFIMSESYYQFLFMFLFFMHI
jgi:hypothetical protein